MGSEPVIGADSQTPAKLADVYMTTLESFRPQIEVELDDVEPGEQVVFHFSNGMKIDGPFIRSGPGFALIRQGRNAALVQLEHVAIMEL